MYHLIQAPCGSGFMYSIFNPSTFEWSYWRTTKEDALRLYNSSYVEHTLDSYLKCTSNPVILDTFTKESHPEYFI